MYDVIPDIHGQSGKLEARLRSLGYQRRRGAHRHPDAARKVVFLGDFIDRGPDNAGVIGIVRAMMEAGTAVAVMGNHELNAIHYHTDDPATGDGLRTRSEKNTRQHASFLAEFPLGSTAAAEAVSWMKSLPLYLDLRDLRAVHACWNEDSIAALGDLTTGGVLPDEDFARTAVPGDPLNELADITLKGPDLPLPRGHAFHDKDGTRRNKVRVAWWLRDPASWDELSISVDDPSELPGGRPPAWAGGGSYPADAPPVFFGHYWLKGLPRLQAANVLCLDYSAGRDGPLLSYSLEPGERQLSLDRLSGVD